MIREEEFSRLEISLPACLENYKYFRSKLSDSTKLLVLVKANAYGHGAVEFATLMEDAGADYLAVAYPVEGIELRQGGIKSPIIVLTAGTDSFEEMINYGLEPGIPNLCTLKALCKVLEKREVKDFPIHIKLDTGMHRLGFMTEEMDELMAYLNECSRVRVKSVYSHLAASDDPDSDEFTREQVELFKKNADRLTDCLGYKPMYHILNSAGIERFPEYQFQIKHLVQADGTIGYGRHGKIAPEGTVIATIPVGYADGVDRHLSRGNASFMLNGHRVPTIGNVCMDMSMLDITGVEAKVGDTVTIFGENPTITELASILGTIPYEILTSVPRRIKRIIVK